MHLSLERSIFRLSALTLPFFLLLLFEVPLPSSLGVPWLLACLLHLALTVVAEFRQIRRSPYPLGWMMRHLPEITMISIAPPLMRSNLAWFGLLLCAQWMLHLRQLSRSDRVARLLVYGLERPSLLLAFSFAWIILLGTILLMAPASTTSGQGLPAIDALFTATSATCVTGLAVKDTGSDFTTFGQIVILILIQIGGLGIMTLSSFIIWLIGQRLGVRGRGAMTEILDEASSERILQMLRFIVLGTLLTEALGTTILTLHWLEPGKPFLPILYQALFHSISAFCNAGFALWSQSLVPFQTDVTVNVTIMGLILLGGMGFPVLASVVEPRLWLDFRRNWRRYSFLWAGRFLFKMLPLHTKIVLLSQVIMVSSLAFLFFLFERQSSIAHLGFGHQALASLFQSVTLRTAGFNTVDFALLTEGTVLLMIFAMFVGGASGGTAGGIKINTFCILVLLVRSILRRREEVEVFGRSVPEENVQRAIAVTTIFACLLASATLLLLVTQTGVPFSHLLFEATSAMGTVGLTMSTLDGAATTSKLDFFGKALITLVMFAGRLGPLTLALAISGVSSSASYRYPDERIYVG